MALRGSCLFLLYFLFSYLPSEHHPPLFHHQIIVPYFHVKALDEGQLKNWRAYLDFEEKEGDLSSTVDLYERALVPCALYEEFWIRYARFLVRRNLIPAADEVYRRALAGFLNKK